MEGKEDFEDCSHLLNEAATAGPILRVLKKLRNEGTPFALQTVRPSHGSDDHLKWRSCLQVET